MNITQKHIKHGTYNTIVTMDEATDGKAVEFVIHHTKTGKKVFLDWKELGVFPSLDLAIQCCVDHLDQDGWYTTENAAKGPWKSRAKAAQEAMGGNVLGPFTSRKLAREARLALDVVRT